MGERRGRRDSFDYRFYEPPRAGESVAEGRARMLLTGKCNGIQATVQSDGSVLVTSQSPEINPDTGRRFEYRCVQVPIPNTNLNRWRCECKAAQYGNRCVHVVAAQEAYDKYIALHPVTLPEPPPEFAQVPDPWVEPHNPAEQMLWSRAFGEEAIDANWEYVLAFLDGEWPDCAYWFFQINGFWPDWWDPLEGERRAPRSTS